MCAVTCNDLFAAELAPIYSFNLLCNQNVVWSSLKIKKRIASRRCSKRPRIEPC